MMLLLVFHMLAQINAAKLPADGSPVLSDTESYGMPWVVALLLTVGILLVTFKTSKRNHMDRG